MNNELMFSSKTDDWEAISNTARFTTITGKYYATQVSLNERRGKNGRIN